MCSSDLPVRQLHLRHLYQDAARPDEHQAPVSEHRFHTKLYEITGNKIITEFQDIIYPVLDFVKEKYRDFLEPIEKELERAGALVTHRDLLKYIENRDLKGYKKAIEEHFRLYSIYLERHKK